MKKRSQKKPDKPVVIVESPAKARTIHKILGSKYKVKACMGHVRDLPEQSFGIDIDNNFSPTYRIIPGKSGIVRELRSAVKDAEAIYLASDPDREGEAIAWHLTETLKIPRDKVRRVILHEITQGGVLKAFKVPTMISMEKVYAQQARRLLDRIVGYKLSPLLWKKVGKGLSAGRVQSVAVKLIVDRERQIEAFKREEYWKISARLKKLEGGPEFTAELKKIDQQEIIVKDQNQAEELVRRIQDERFYVIRLEQREKIEPPPPPFTTSLLQQRASTKLKFSARKTMFLAQQLYEGIDIGQEGAVGLITYMRTDSFNVAPEAIQECREAIIRIYGEGYLNEHPRHYPSKKGAQEAHETIRPTLVSRTPESVKPFLTEDQYRLYQLIWERFVTTQMKPVIYLLTEVHIGAGPALFIAKGRETKFDGYTIVTGTKLKKDEQLLPQLFEGEELKLESLTPSQHFTDPPPRYTEATLIRTLERFGIGRPSTYAPILSTIQERGYVYQQDRKLHPTELGTLVTEKLTQYFTDILATEFTAQMEEKLDQIEEAKIAWVDVLDEFYRVFSNELQSAIQAMQIEKGRPPDELVTCEKCGQPMVVRWNKYGKFLGCSGFPRCKNARPLAGTESRSCRKCGSPMVIKRGKFGRFLGCSRYPECTNVEPLELKDQVKVPEGTQILCQSCGGPMVLKSTRRGKFLACSSYPRCKNTSPVPQEWYQTAD
jgi:DNA topoisomerase-1